MIKRWFSRRSPPRLQVLVVCMGNICRSPMAEAVLLAKLDRAGLGKVVAVDSAGTHGFHKGSAPDPRAVAQAAKRGYRLDGLKSRPLVPEDFSRFDLVVGMDHNNLATMRERCPPALHDRLGLLLSYAPHLGVDEVPDPYYGSVASFDQALDLIEPACEGLLKLLQKRLSTAA
jgi:protein-tyrosine phosphatase